MSIRSRRTVRRLVTTALVVAVAIAVFAPLSAQQDDAALRARVEAFQQSLKTAWDAGDRDAVLTHFQHADVLPPTPGQYSMLGRFPFWDRPLAAVTRNPDGTLGAEFVMDPDSDSPAFRMSFTLIDASDGRLQVKSAATPEELAEGRRRLEERATLTDRFAELTAALDARPPFESELLPVLVDYFWAQGEKRAAASGQPIPAEWRENIRFLPVGELYHGDRAAFFVTVAMAGQGVDVLGVGFIRQDGVWTATEQGFTRPEGVSEFLGTASGYEVRRAPGLSVDQIPLYVAYVQSELRAQAAAAEAAEDMDETLRLLDHLLVGMPLARVPDAQRDLTDPSRDPSIIRLGRHQLGETTGIVDLEYVDDDGDIEVRPTKLAREGDGWVIAGDYETPSDQTAAMFRLLGSVLALYEDANGGYPTAASGDELLAALRTIMPDAPLATTDGWGHAYRYVVSDDHQTYRLISPGADGTFDHGDWDPTPERIRDQESTDVKSDIVFENGRFGRWHADGIW